jgi:hypothetical protein
MGNSQGNSSVLLQNLRGSCISSGTWLLPAYSYPPMMLELKHGIELGFWLLIIWV